jgi:hypothetical protein
MLFRANFRHARRHPCSSDAGNHLNHHALTRRESGQRGHASHARAHAGGSCVQFHGDFCDDAIPSTPHGASRRPGLAGSDDSANGRDVLLRCSSIAGRRHTGRNVFGQRVSNSRRRFARRAGDPDGELVPTRVTRAARSFWPLYIFLKSEAIPAATERSHNRRRLARRAGYAHCKRAGRWRPRPHFKEG